MRINIEKLSALCVGIVLTAHGAECSAAPYGDTIRPVIGYFCGLKTYTVPITVSVSSRIYVAMSASVQNGDNAHYYSLAVSAHLYDAGDNTELAKIYGQTTEFGPADYLTNRSVNASAIMMSTQNSTTYTAVPGNYVLHFELDAGACVGANLEVYGYPEFSYLLLSSAFDRIFADGFA